MQGRSRGSEAAVVVVMSVSDWEWNVTAGDCQVDVSGRYEGMAMSEDAFVPVMPGSDAKSRHCMSMPVEFGVALKGRTGVPKGWRGAGAVLAARSKTMAI